MTYVTKNNETFRAILFDGSHHMKQAILDLGKVCKGNPTFYRAEHDMEDFLVISDNGCKCRVEVGDYVLIDADKQMTSCTAAQFARDYAEVKSKVMVPNAPPILKHFEYKDLSPELQKVVMPLCEFAELMATSVDPSAELSAGLRKLLEAKDCFVRASL